MIINRLNQIKFEFVIPTTTKESLVLSRIENYLLTIFSHPCSTLYSFMNNCFGDIIFPNPIVTTTSIIYAGEINPELADILAYSPHLRRSKDKYVFKGSHKKLSLIFEDAFLLYLTSLKTK